MLQMKVNGLPHDYIACYVNNFVCSLHVDIWHFNLIYYLLLDSEELYTVKWAIIHVGAELGQLFREKEGEVHNHWMDLVAEFHGVLEAMHSEEGMSSCSIFMVWK